MTRLKGVQTIKNVTYRWKKKKTEPIELSAGLAQKTLKVKLEHLLTKNR